MILYRILAKSSYPYPYLSQPWKYQHIWLLWVWCGIYFVKLEIFTVLLWSYSDASQQTLTRPAFRASGRDREAKKPLNRDRDRDSEYTQIETGSETETMKLARDRDGTETFTKQGGSNSQKTRKWPKEIHFFAEKSRHFGIFNLQKMVFWHRAAAVCNIFPKIEFGLQSILFRRALKVPPFRSI